MGGFLDGVASGLDTLAGSTDEAVGKAVSSAQKGDMAGVGDALAGGTDKATGSILSGTWDATLDTVYDKRPNDPTGDNIDIPGPSFGEAVNQSMSGLLQYGMNNPAVGFVMLLIVVYFLGQLFNVQVGGGASA